jgi:hypothetical protein
VNRKTRGLLIGAVSGALLGATLAWVLLSRESIDAGGAPSRARLRIRAATGDWFRLGMSILQAGRNMAEMIRLA